MRRQLGLATEPDAMRHHPLRPSPVLARINARSPYQGRAQRLYIGQREGLTMAQRREEANRASGA
jgi:hypothetical protein